MTEPTTIDEKVKCIWKRVAEMNAKHNSHQDNKLDYCISECGGHRISCICYVPYDKYYQKTQEEGRAV